MEERVSGGLITVIRRAFVDFAIHQEAFESMGMETLVYNRLVHRRGNLDPVPLRSDCAVLGLVSMSKKLGLFLSLIFVSNKIR